MPFGTSDWREAFAAVNTAGEGPRPMTAAKHSISVAEPAPAPVMQEVIERPDAGSVVAGSVARGELLTIELLCTWGDAHYVGLTGLELYRTGVSCRSCASAT